MASKKKSPSIESIVFRKKKVKPKKNQDVSLTKRLRNQKTNTIQSKGKKYKRKQYEVKVTKSKDPTKRFDDFVALSKEVQKQFGKGYRVWVDVLGQQAGSMITTVDGAIAYAATKMVQGSYGGKAITGLRFSGLRREKMKPGKGKLVLKSKRGKKK